MPIPRKSHDEFFQTQDSFYANFTFISDGLLNDDENDDDIESHGIFSNHLQHLFEIYMSMFDERIEESTESSTNVNYEENNEENYQENLFNLSIPILPSINFSYYHVISRFDLHFYSTNLEKKKKIIHFPTDIEIDRYFKKEFFKILKNKPDYKIYKMIKATEIATGTKRIQEMKFLVNKNQQLYLQQFINRKRTPNILFRRN